MDDKEIIDQFWARSESAIKAISDKYSKYCRAIASNILGNAEDVVLSFKIKIMITAVLI